MECNEHKSLAELTLTTASSFQIKTTQRFVVSGIDRLIFAPVV